MERKPAVPELKARIRQVGRSANQLLRVEYFMRQYPTLSKGVSKLVEQYETERKLLGSSKRFAH